MEDSRKYNQIEKMLSNLILGGNLDYTTYEVYYMDTTRHTGINTKIDKLLKIASELLDESYL